MTDGPAMPGVPMCRLAQLLELMDDLRGKRVTLMGLGLFGGGAGAAQLLVRLGAELTVTDLRDAECLAPSIDRLDGLDVAYRLEHHEQGDFTGADLVVANPAVPRDNHYLQAAHDAGVPITSPMNIFLALCPAPVVGVTGSNGKSTTTGMLHRILQGTGRKAWLGGNIGISLLPSLERIDRRDIVVLELSSFQLQDAAWIERSPHLAVVTNISPNHLDRHGTMQDYERAKQTIVRYQGAADYAVLNAQDDRLRRWARSGLPAQTVYFNPEPHPGDITHGMNLMGDRLVWHGDRGHEVVCTADDLPLPGPHNAANALAAATAARCLGATRENIRQGLAQFRGLEHRLELVGESGGVRFFNDSFSTTPVSTIAALESFHGSLVLIAGGYDKKLEIDELARAVAERAEVLVTIGQTGPALAQQVRAASAAVGRNVLIREADNLEKAVREAESHSMPGTSVLLSPAFASYDMFENCIQRGKLFKDIVRRCFLQDHTRSRGA